MFKRSNGHFSYLIFRERWKNVLNIINILKAPDQLLFDFFHDGSSENCETYAMSILKDFIDKKHQYRVAFVRNCHKIIEKLDIHLTGEERNYFFEVEEIIFTLTRKFKNLVVPIPLTENIFCFARMQNVSFFEIRKDKLLNNLVKGELFFTNAYITFESNKRLSKIYYNDIKKIVFEDYGVLITLNPNTAFKKKAFYIKLLKVKIFQIYLFHVLKFFFNNKLNIDLLNCDEVVKKRI